MTAVGFGPLQRIDGPPPLAPLYGLLQAATARSVRVIGDEVDAAGIERWLNGAQVYPFPPSQPDAFDTCASGSSSQEKNFGDELELPIFAAFTAYLAETCSAFRVWSHDEFKARASSALAAVEGMIVEAVLMGTVDRLLENPHLADGNGNFPRGDDGLGVVEAFGILDSEIARSAKQGLIHVSPRCLAAAFGARAVVMDDQAKVWRSANGNVVVPGTGYQQPSDSDWVSQEPTKWELGPPAPAGTGFTDADSGTEWMYASGPVDVRRTQSFTTPDDVSQAVERGTGGASTGRPNSVNYRAERYYLVDWDTVVQSAVRVELCTPYCHSIT